MNLRYFDISWFSKVDGPGNRVVLYAQGCRVGCPWCHSPHSQPRTAPILFNIKRCIGCNNCIEACSNRVHYTEDGLHKLNRNNCVSCGKCIEVCPTSACDNLTGALVLPTKEAAPYEIFELLLPQLDTVKKSGGLTISGGEALLQKEAVLELLQYCKKRDIHTAIESSLTLPKDTYKYVNEYVDCWLIGMRDITFDNSQGSISDKMIENVSFIGALNKQVIVRFPIIKGYTASRLQLERTAKLMNIGGFDSIQLLPCNRHMEHYYILSGTSLSLKVEELLPSRDELAAVSDFYTAEGFKAEII